MTIKNGDMPAVPLVNELGHPYHASNVAFDNKPLCVGLTKREKFAMAALQGILASKYFSDFCNVSELEDKRGASAEVAVKHADALLAELEKLHD